MKTLRHPFFISCFLIWVLNQLLELQGIYIWPLFSYLDDLLCLPFTLTFILAVQRLYFRDLNITIPFEHILFAVIAYAICFEWVLPAISEVYTADVLDVLAYTIGAVGFGLVLNKPLVPQYE